MSHIIQKEHSVIEKFFGGPWFDCVKCMKYPIIVFGLGIAGYAAYRSTEIRGLSSME
jgi:hypothetical protein